MRKLTFIITVGMAMLLFGVGPVAATEPRTLVVDRDGVQCANADFTSIQAAVDAAQPGDLVRVCPDRYPETVTVDKPLTLKGDPDAVEALDCFQPTPSQLGDADPTQQAIVDPGGDGFLVAFKLQANDIALEGFVVQGASVGVDANDRFSGYQVHHNLIRLNTLFGMDFGSNGAQASRVDHNCIRENQFGLMSELDDDSLWKPSDGPERDEWNARDLRNARLDHNATFRNGAGGWGAGLEAGGPGQRDQVTFDHNVSREDLIGIALQNATVSAIVDNEIVSPERFAIVLGGANDRLEIRSNVVRARGIGVRFQRSDFIDVLPVPSRNVVVTENDVRGAGAGIYAREDNLVDSLISENTTSENLTNGIILFSGNTGNVVRANHADNNGIAGITALLGATGNRFEQNSMHGNGRLSGTQAPGADARDLNTSINVWINNDCDTDIPAGMICGVG